MINCLKHKTEHDTKVGKCLDCIEESIQKHIHRNRPKLLEELVRLYNLSLPIKILYVSELSNNLSKVHKHLNESVDFSVNPGCTITLAYPSPGALKALQGGYDLVYIDNDISEKDYVLYNVKAKEEAMAFIIEPIKQEIM
jgi:hypothetical protein